MGFGLPAAIGAKIAAPERLVIDIDGDGSLNMTVQELACCHRYQIGVKIIVINNQWLGMVRQWQDMIYDGHRATTDLTSPHTDAIYPNFLKIAEGYGITAERVSDKSELTAALQRLLQNPDEPYLLDVIVEAEENVYPMIPAGGSYRDIMLSDVDRDSSADRQGSNI
jgi:acetolactate synthase-1/2/3 large subunit